ncbi:MAG TPA: carboxymuconolactone decarboxylase family protein [Planctomycetota bacterium]|nr:carboxymuconolactone decarboxylase family protein [Planctomycetota bacterium]
MARIPLLQTSDVDPSCAPLFQDFERERGAVPNMFRALSHDPELLKTWFAMFRATLREGAVSTRVKEMVAVRVSKLNTCRY